MFNLKKICAIAISGIIMGSLLTSCDDKTSITYEDKEETKDIIQVWTFPVEKDYQKTFQQIKSDFEGKNKNVEIEVEELSWSEGMEKFDAAINDGIPPDIMFVKPSEKYVQTGLAVPVENYINKEILEEYYPNILEYMKVAGKFYGLPLYSEPHTIGGNKRLLEEAGIDWEKIQKEGWTWDEFKQLAKKGTKKNSDGIQQYGLVFHGAGEPLVSVELLDHMTKNNGLPYDVDKKNNYVLTDPRFLETAKFIKSLIDEEIMPKDSSEITPAKRMEYFYSHKAMMVGKVMPYYEEVIQDNNKKVKDGKAPIGQKQVEFVLLPEPHNKGENPVTVGEVEGYSIFKQKNYKGDVLQEEHLKNTANFLVALTSGKAGASAVGLCVPQITKSGEVMWNNKYTMKPENKASVDILFKNFMPALQCDSTISKKADKIKNEVIIPQYSALLKGEITPEQMYDAVKDKAQKEFRK